MGGGRAGWAGPERGIVPRSDWILTPDPGPHRSGLGAWICARRQTSPCPKVSSSNRLHCAACSTDLQACLFQCGIGLGGLLHTLFIPLKQTINVNRKKTEYFLL